MNSKINSFSIANGRKIFENLFVYLHLYSLLFSFLEKNGILLYDVYFVMIFDGLVALNLTNIYKRVKKNVLILEQVLRTFLPYRGLKYKMVYPGFECVPEIV